MQAYLDDAPLELDRATFAAAIQAAEASARRRGRIISEVYLDGNPVQGAILQSPPEAPLGQEVRMVSAAAVAPVWVGRLSEPTVGTECRPTPQPRLAEALEALDHAAALQAQAAALIQTARLEDALRPLSGAIQGWQAVQQIVVAELSWATGSEAFNAMLTDLAANLREVHGALQRQDWSALSDALAFDMKEQAEGWRMLLEGVSKQAE